MTSLVIGIILIVGGIAFAAAPFFRRGEPRDAGATPPPREADGDDRNAEHWAENAGATRGMQGADLPPIPSSLLAELEELELDRAMGKLGDEDYRQLRASWDRRAAADRTIAGASGGVPADAPEPVDDTSHAGKGDTAIGAAASAAEMAVTGVGPERSSVDAVVPPPDHVAEAERLVHAARGAVVRCRNCGPRPEPAASYCSHCGTPVGACPSCGANIRQDNARFCDRCGSSLGAA